LPHRRVLRHAESDDELDRHVYQNFRAGVLLFDAGKGPHTVDGVGGVDGELAGGVAPCHRRVVAPFIDIINGKERRLRNLSERRRRCSQQQNGSYFLMA
jgi:hypothetical protein